MKLLKKYWKLLIALALIGAAIFLYQDKYKPEREAHEAKMQQLAQVSEAVQRNIEKNLRYKDIQDELDEAKVELDNSRLSLYQHFPVELKEEDQIMYVLYLETLFDTEIHFNFSQAQPITALYDGANLQGMILQVNYETTYEGFQEMVNYLATDEKVVSIYDATIAYDAENNVAVGTINLILYLMNSDKLEYTAPDVAIPELGKDNLFE